MPAAPPPFDVAAVRGVIFDLDGTLVDSYPAIAASLNHARTRFGLAPLEDAEVRRRVGRGLESLVAELVDPDRVEEGVRLFRERYAEVFESGTTALEGARETLCRLRRRGLRLAVASNKPARFSEPILERLQLREALDAVLGPDVCGRHKPHPAMLEACLARMGVDRARALYVGDMVLDVETAARAGVPVLLVRGGSSSDGELAATGQRVVASLAAVGRLLARAAPGAAAAG